MHLRINFWDKWVGCTKIAKNRLRNIFRDAFDPLSRTGKKQVIKNYSFGKKHSSCNPRTLV